MTIPKINSAHGSDTRNIINRAIDLINAQGKSIQDLVAEGQLTPSQYAELISIVNGNVKKGSITAADIDKNNFRLDQTHLSDELLQQMAGNTPVNAIPADKSISPIKLNFDNGFLGMFIARHKDQYITFKETAREMVVPIGSVWVKQRYFTNSTSIVIDLTPIHNSGIKRGSIFLDTSTNTFKVITADSLSMIQDFDILIATIQVGSGVDEIVHVSCISEYKIEGRNYLPDKVVSSSSVETNFNNAFYGLYVGREPMMIDEYEKEMRVGIGYISIKGTTWATTTQTVDLSDIYNSTFNGMIFYDPLGKKFHAISFENMSSIGESYILIANILVRNGKIANITCPSAYRINGELGSDILSLTRSLDIQRTRLLLPSKLYFVKGQQLPLYKSSIVSNFKNDLNVKTVLIQEQDDGSPNFEYFSDQIELKGEELGEQFDIGLEHYDKGWQTYYNTIDTVVTDPNDVVNTSPNITCIGDSLTFLSTPTFLKNKLTALGLTPIFNGTYNDRGKTLAEGRGGWSYVNYIGKSNQFPGGTITPSTTGATTTDKQNPFLKIATEEDKSAHPTWCFRNTGSESELSYAEDSDKTGDFWIFDFSAYLEKHSIPNPDVVTIALSVNDRGQSGYEQGLINSALGLKIMTTKIKEAVPNCKIGVIPYGIPSPNAVEEIPKYFAEWTDISQSYVEGLNEPNISIVPQWVSMNKYWIYPTEDPSYLVENSNMKYAGITDSTHWGDRGKHQYTNVMAAWAISQLV